jgi:hypothetical protein
MAMKYNIIFYSENFLNVPYIIATVDLQINHLANLIETAHKMAVDSFVKKRQDRCPGDVVSAWYRGAKGLEIESRQGIGW